MNSVEIHSIVLVCYIWLGLIVIIFYHDRVIFGSIQLTLRSLTLYIYGAPVLDVSRSHTTTQHSR